MIHLAGHLDVRGAAAFEHALALARQAGKRHIELDMTGVELLDSSGARMLIAAHEALAADGGSLTLRHASPAVRRFVDVMRRAVSA